MTNGKLKRFLAFLLSFTLILSMNSMSVFAEETYGETENAIVYTVDSETGETPAYQESEPVQTETQIQESQTSADTGADESVKETPAQTESAKETTKESESETETETETETKEEDNAPTTTNLNALTSGLSIEGLDIGPDGKYKVIEGQRYTFAVSFAEQKNLQFNMDQPLVYTLPAGIDSAILTGVTFPLTVTTAEGTFTITGTCTKVNNTLQVTWDSSDPNFAKVKGATNARFSLDFTGLFNRDATDIDFGAGEKIIIEFDETHGLEIKKDGSFKLETNSDGSAKSGKITYTVTLTSTGRNKDVIVYDSMEGTLLTYNNDLTYSGNSTTPIVESVDKGFKLKFPQMENKETITFKYSANVDVKNAGSQKLTTAQTKNTVAAWPEAEASDPSHKTTATKSFSGSIISSMTKSGVYDADGYVNWTVVINKEQTVPMGGGFVKDTITALYGSTDYSGSGINIAITDEAGNTSSITKSWADIGKTTDSTGRPTWTWDIPADHGKYKYVITYQTKTDLDKIVGKRNVTNKVETNNLSSSEKSVEVNPGTPAPTVTKSLDRNALTDTEAGWNVKITLPGGKTYTSVKLEDTVPNKSSYTDAYIADSVVVTGLDTAGGEGYTASYANKVLTVNFTNLKRTDSTRTINVFLKTNINQNWVNKTASDYSYKRHTNTAKLTVNGSSYTDTAYFDKTKVDVSIKKTVGEQKKYSDGMPYYEYTLVFSGINTTDSNNLFINDVFDTRYFMVVPETISVKTGNDATNPNSETATTVVPVNTDTGATFTATVPESFVGKYDFYKIVYKLKVKDQGALDALKAQAAAHGENFSISNTAEFMGKSAGIDKDYKYDVLSKTGPAKDEMDNEHRIAHYVISLNPDGVKLNGGKEYEAIDQMSDALNILEDTIVKPEGVTYDIDGHKITFTVPDGKWIAIEYDALVTGTGKLDLQNKVEIPGHSEETNIKPSFTPSGEGSATLLSIKFRKSETGNNSQPVVGAKFDLRDENGTKLTELITDANGVMSITSTEALPLYAFSTYTLTETYAPDGYTKLTQPISFQLSDDPAKTDITKGIYPIGYTIPLTDNYNSRNTLPLSGKKTINGRNLKTGEKFTFELYEEGNETALQTVQNKADGTIEFAPLSYSTTKSGTTETHTYIVKEAKAGTKENGLTYSNKEYKFTVTAKDNKNGTMTVTSDPQVNIALNFTNDYEEKGSVAFSGKKLLNGRLLKDKEFTFALYEGPADQIKGKTPIETVKNNANGDIVFSSINYSSKKNGDVAKHTYTVVEVPGTDPSIEYATDPVEITVDVKMSKDGKGQLDITTSDNAIGFKFTNNYKASGEVSFSGHKVLDNRKLKDKEFTFKVYEIVDGKEVEKLSATNNAEGEIALGKITYTASDIGTHVYKVKEVKGTDGSITYDATVYDVTVEVKATDTEKLDVKVTKGDPAALNFKNTYSANGRASFSGHKVLENRGVKDQEFTFKLYQIVDGKEVELQTVKNNAAGEIKFADIEYTQKDYGTYQYIVKEVKGDAAGITYDDTVYTIDVKVSASQSSSLNVDVSKNATALNFTNTYEATGSQPFHGTKVLENRDLKNEEFTFKLYEVVDGKEVELQTVKNTAAGAINFADVQYTQADIGEHTYTVKEVKETESGIIYDRTVYTVKVKVSATETTKLSVVPTEGDPTALIFTNKYSASGKASFSGHKVLNNRDIEDKEFSFTLYQLVDGVETEIETVTNNAAGEIKFTDIQYTQKDYGEYTYVVKENAGEEESMTYDDTVYTVHVKVSPSESADLNVKVDEVAAALNFTNTYEATGSQPFSGHKVLENRDLKDQEFTFKLYEVIDGKEVELQTVKNNAAGEITFADVQYTQENIGDHVYKVKEIKEDESGITYDATVYTVNVKVEATKTPALKVTPSVDATALNFKNTYSASGRASFSGHKKLENRDLKDKEFTFVLTEVFEDGTTKEIQRVQNNAAGEIAFDDVVYSEKNVGTHYYTVAEVNDSKPGITYSDTVYDVTVEVAVSDTDALKVDVSENAKALDFVNEYHATGDVVFTGTKVLEHRELKDEEFTFELYAVTDDGEEFLQAVTNDVDGHVEFGVISFTEEHYGTYKYRVKEVIEESDCVIYDETVKDITVTVGPSETETLDIQVSEEGKGFVFENTYVATGSQPFTGKKVLEHRDLKNDEFTFVLSEIIDGEEVELQTVKNTADGNIPFEAINYDETNIGTHTYKVKELIPEETASCIEYDEATVYTVVVEVAATDTKDLSVVATEGDPAALNFTNKYHGTGSQPFYGVKSLDNYPLAKDNFTFELYEVAEDGTENLLQSVKNDGEGNIAFEAVNYTEENLGVHTYTVKEVKEDQKGVTYDAKVYTIKVNVKPGEDDRLVIETEGDDPTALKFENLYRDSKVTVTARKVFIGEPIKDGQFKFRLKGTSENTKDVDMTAACKADGSIAFDELVYTDEGTYKYTLSEIIPEKDDPDFDPEMGYDTNVYDITVVVTIDPETHDVTADYSVVGEYAYPLFVNRTNIGHLETQIQLGAKKELKGGELRDDQFEFVLKSTGYPDKYYPETGDFEKGEFTKFESITVKNKADGTIALPVIYMNTVGNYTFDMYEVAGDSPLYKYDDTVHKVVVTTDTDEMGKLVVTNVTIDGVATTDYTMTFVNEKSEAKPVKVKVSAKKVLKGGTLTANMFEFALKGTSDNTDKKEVVVKNDASGNVTFPEMEYKEAGTYTYDLYEIKGTNALMKYDTTVHKVVVEVTENEKTGEFEAVVKTDEKDAAATFTNTLTPSGGGGGGGVGTGDHTPVMALMLIMLLSAAVIAFIFFKKRKRA